MRWVFLLMGFILSAYCLVSWTVGREGHGRSPLIIAQIGFSILILAIAWFSESLMINIPMAIAGSILLLGNAVRWRRGRDDLHVWDFTHKLWTGAVFATVGSIIFLLGVLAITAALKSLFSLDIQDFMMEVILPVGLGFLAPLYWMSTLPPANESYQELHENPGFVSKAVAFLGTWLLAPLILIYAAILLAYGVKIVLAGSLPKGEIAQLTTPFLIIGTLTWLVLEPPFVQDKWLARTFRKVWFWISVPVALLLGIAVIVRITNYGLTEERVLMFLGFIWALGIGLWFSLMKPVRRDIRFIPGFAAVLLIVASLLASRASIVNQDKRFAHFMKKSGLVSAEGEFQGANALTDEEAAQKAKGALQYLIGKSATRIDKRLSKWGVEASTERFPELSETLGLGDININARDVLVSYHKGGHSIDVKGFEKVWPGQHFGFAGDVSGVPARDLVSFEESKLSTRDHYFILTQSGAEIARFDFKTWVNGLDVSDSEFQIPNPRIVILDEEGRNVTLHVTNLSRWGNDNINGQIVVLTRGFDAKP